MVSLVILESNNVFFRGSPGFIGFPAFPVEWFLQVGGGTFQHPCGQRGMSLLSGSDCGR